MDNPLEFEVPQGIRHRINIHKSGAISLVTDYPGQMSASFFPDNDPVVDIKDSNAHELNQLRKMLETHNIHFDKKTKQYIFKQRKTGGIS